MTTFYGDVRETFKSLLNGDILADCVRLKVTGQARFRFSIRQRVLVNEKDLDITQASGRKNIPTAIPKSGPTQPLPQPKPAQQYNPEPVSKPGSSQPVSQPSEQVSPGPSMHTIFSPISQPNPSGPARPGPSKPNIYLPRIQHPAPQPCYHAVGLKFAKGEFKEIIPKNARLPITERYKHSTMRYFRTESKFYIYERKHHIVENNKFLGRLTLYKEKFVPSKIIITFRLEEDGTLCVTAKDQKSGKQHQFKVQLQKIEM